MCGASVGIGEGKTVMGLSTEETTPVVGGRGAMTIVIRDVGIVVGDRSTRLR